MPAGALHIAVGDGAAKGEEGVYDLARLLRREEPVAREAEDEPLAAAAREAGAELRRRGAEVEAVHRHRERVVAVGVKALDELVPLVGKVGADGKLFLEIGGHLTGAEGAAAKLPLHRLRREVGDVAEHASKGEADAGPRALVVVPPFVEVRIAQDRVAADDIEGEGLHRKAGRGGHRERAPHTGGVVGGPLEDLVAAHRTADHAAKDLHLEPVHEALLNLDDIGHGDCGKISPVAMAAFRVDAVGPGGPATTAKDVRADHEVALGIDGLAGPDHGIPPAGGIGGVVSRDVGIAAERVADEDGVVAGAVELSVGFVDDGNFRQVAAELEAEFSEGRLARVAERPRAAGAVAALKGGARRGLHGRLFLRGMEGLVKVGLDVGEVLEADGEAEVVGGDAGRLLLGGGELLVGG